MTFPQAGVYILFPVIFCDVGEFSINEVAIVFDSTLTDVVVNNDSINAATFVGNRTLSFANITSGAGGTIVFPDSLSLTSIYGANWSSCSCIQMFVHRLS